MARKQKQNRWIWKVRISGFLRAFIVALLVLVQFLFIFQLSDWLRESTVYYYTLLSIASFLVIILLVNDNKSASYKVIWIAICLALPISGHIMFILWGNSTSSRKMEKESRRRMSYGRDFLDFSEETMKIYEEMYGYRSRIAKYLEAKHFPLYKNNQMRYYGMGQEAFAAILEDMRKAKRFIFLEFYIVAEGRLWDEFYEILKQKRREGVEVRFHIDDFGSLFRTSKYFRDELEEEGIQVRIFNPVHRYIQKLYMNFRSHQKLIIIDGEIAYTGGINLADEYANYITRFGVWKDAAIRVHGDAAWGFTNAFLQMWDASDAGAPFSDYDAYRPTGMFAENNRFCQFFTDGPIFPDNPAEKVYHQMVDSAQKHLYITTPYLIIDEKMRDTLCFAAKAGVDVRIITPGIPDKKAVKLLTNYNYGVLLENGVRIYEYTPGFIHSKIILNEQCAIVGTINMDYRSFYLQFEDGAYLTDSMVVEEIRADLEKTFEECKEINYEAWIKRPLRWKIVQPLLNLMSTLL